MQHLETVQALLPEHIRLTLLEPDCQWFRVEQSGDPMIWLVDEGFSDQAAFDAHQARTKTSIWAQRTADIAREFQINTAHG